MDERMCHFNQQISLERAQLGGKKVAPIFTNGVFDFPFCPEPSIEIVDARMKDLFGGWSPGYVDSSRQSQLSSR